MRTYSSYYSEDAGILLKKLADLDTPIEEYRASFFKLGKILAKVVDSKFKLSQEKLTLACASEDADWLTKGLIEGLDYKELALAVFWNKSILFENTNIKVAPILKSYIEDFSNSKYLIISKSIILTACVVKTQITRLIDKVDPLKVIIVAPVIFKDSEEALKNEFPDRISSKFEFVYFAIDDFCSETGEVVPGIGGMVYERLGLGDSNKKNYYIPSIVKERRGLNTSLEYKKLSNSKK